MTATIAETPENLSDDALYPTGPDDGDDVPAGEDSAAYAPYGMMRDPETGLLRPKKSPGRPKKPPSAEELAGRPPLKPAQDEPPRERKGKRTPAPDSVPMPRGGVIAAGVNRLYRRAGKFLRIVDDELGLAVIECTRPDPDDPDELTVGQAWENLAKANPRVRAWLLNLIKGGGWQDLLMAHAPIGLALMTKDWVRKLVPLHRAAEVLLEEDEDTQPSDLRPADAEEMRDMAEAQAHKIASRLGVKVPPNVAAAAMAQAQDMAAAGMTGVPPGLRRHQPKRATRAGRKGR